MSVKLEFYENIGNWEFSMISYHEEILENEFDYFKWIECYTNGESVCFDIGTGGGEKVLNRNRDSIGWQYPEYRYRG